MIKLAIVGAGSVRCAVPVLASLGSYFGERPMEIALYDADMERLELFDALARTIFKTNKTPHLVESYSNVEEALAGSEKVILQLDENCAMKWIPSKKLRAKEAIEAAIDLAYGSIPGEAQVVSLLGPDVRIPLDYYYRLDWPGQPTADELRALPHQVLRWVRGEEYVFELLREFQSSPLKEWLENVNAATVIWRS